MTLSVPVTSINSKINGFIEIPISIDSLHYWMTKRLFSGWYFGTFYDEQIIAFKYYILEASGKTIYVIDLHSKKQN